MNRILCLLASLALLAAGEEVARFPEMAPTVGKLLEANYYDRQRVQPRVMVARALRALENAEVAVEASWNGDAISLNLAGKMERIPAPVPEDLAGAMALIEKVRLALAASQLFSEGGGPRDERRLRELDYAMINGALLSLDPHTYIDPPEPAKEISEGLAGEFYGIGAFLNQEEGLITIERVMPGLPAERSGIEDGDIILAVDGEKTSGLALDQAVRRIKGPKGTTVTLTIERKGHRESLSIPVVRDLVKVITIRSWRRDGVGYVRLDEFNQNAAGELARAISDLQGRGPLKALILDLRFNPGGILDQAEQVAELLLPKGMEIVQTVTANGQASPRLSSSRMATDVPVVVLVSGGSASASEIVSGCLQRNDRALVAGTPTFGKGTVQTMRTLRDQSRLRLTIQEYRLPGGVSIQGVGVTPDLRLVRRAVRRDQGVDLRPFTGRTEGDDEFAIENRNAYRHESTYSLAWLAAWRSREEARRFSIAARDFQPDQEALLVVDLLQACIAQPGYDDAARDAARDRKWRQFLIKRLETPVREFSERESTALGQALMSRPSTAGGPVAWGPLAPPRAGLVGAAYTGPQVIEAGQPVRLSFQVDNRNEWLLGRIFGVVKADPGSPFWEGEVVFGEVPSASSSTGALSMLAPPRLFAGEERLSLDVYADGRKEPFATVPVRLKVKGQPRPRFSYSWSLVDDAVLRPGGGATVRITLINDGDGPSGPVVARVFKHDDLYVQLGENRQRFEEGIPAGGRVSFDVPVTLRDQVNKRSFNDAHGDTIRLQLAAQEDFSLRQGGDQGEDVDGRYRAGLAHTLVIKVGEARGQGRTVIPPRIDLVSAEVEPIQGGKGGVATVSVRVQDDNPRLMVLFHDEDKVELRLLESGSGKQQMVIPLKPLRLKPGINAVRVLVADHDQAEGFLPLRLWGEGEPDTKSTVRRDDHAEMP